MSDILVVYYSRSGTTARAAKVVAEALGADLEAIVPLRAYDGPFGFLRCLAQTARGTRPDIADHRDPSGYRLVVVGCPVWAGRAAAPLRTWLAVHRRHLPPVAAFCTSQSGDARAVFQQLEADLGRPLAASLSLARPGVVSGAAGGAAADWARGLGAGAAAAARAA